jgi:hypothetical protein
MNENAELKSFKKKKKKTEQKCVLKVGGRKSEFCPTVGADI